MTTITITAGDFSVRTTTLDQGAVQPVIESGSYQVVDIDSARSLAELLSRVVDLLPPTLSDIEVERLRAQFPPMKAADDPATYEFDVG